MPIQSLVQRFHKLVICKKISNSSHRSVISSLEAKCIDAAAEVAAKQAAYNVLLEESKQREKNKAARRTT